MIKIAAAYGFTTDELRQLDTCVEAANKALQSKEFSAKVLAANFTWANGLTNAQVLDLILTKTAAVSFYIQSYSWWNFGKRSEVAHENADGSVVFNRRFFDNENLGEHGNTAAHEHCHVLGFSHPYQRGAERDASVAYQVGNFVEQVINNV